MPGTFSTQQPKSPEGLPLCFWCKKLVIAPRQTFCSDNCVHEWKLRTDSGYVRGLLFERDHGVCSVCKVDTVALYQAFRAACRAALGNPNAWSYNHRRPHPALVPVIERLRSLDIDPHRLTFWDADHIVPVVDDGGECGLDGYRTICIPCHKKISGELASKRAAKKRAARDAKAQALSTPVGKRSADAA